MGEPTARRPSERKSRGLEGGPAGLLQVLEACGALLVAMVRTTPPQTRAHHVFGVLDPEGFAGMGIVETLVHTHDLTQGLRLVWNPPADPPALTAGVRTGPRPSRRRRPPHVPGPSRWRWPRR